MANRPHIVQCPRRLLQGGRKRKEHAALYLKQKTPSLDDVGAVALEKQTNEGALFQKVMFAKIVAEFVGAVEDFGALCFAVIPISWTGRWPRRLPFCLM